MDDDLSSVLGMPQKLVNFLYSDLAADAETANLLQAAWSFVIIILMIFGIAILYSRVLMQYMTGIKYNDWRERKGTGLNLFFAIILLNAWFVMDKVVEFTFWLTE